MEFFETSAKENINIKEMFTKMAILIKNNFEIDNGDSIKISYD
jgi:hypothetical protein